MHKGEKYYGLLTDIWSAGVVLYAMAFGYLPFCDDDEEINITNIIEGNYEIPNTASPELYDLLLHLLDINPITRYDLDQIKVHPWYNMISSENNRPGLIVGYHKIPVDERIINICLTYGYDTNKVRESVINNNYDNNSSIYYIILNKMKSMGIDSISDLNSVEYLNYINDPNNIILGKRNIFNNNKFITDDDSNINYKNNNFLNNNINIQFFSTINPNDNIHGNNFKKYENIIPKTNIQFAILTHPNKDNNKSKKNNTDLINKKQKQEVKYNPRKRNISEIANDFDINEKHTKRNNSGGKHNKEEKNNNKRIVESTKKAKDKKINIFNVKQILHISNENINKKEKPKIDHNNYIYKLIL
jgi:5'-AMP-activated protein kinase catalytic alpha subunit